MPFTYPYAAVGGLCPGCRPIGDTVAASMADMMFDLECRHCGRRGQRRWESSKNVTVTHCPTCKRGMSVVGIAFFRASRPEQAAA